MSSKLVTSPLQLGDWLERTFGEEILTRRRARERASTALERGAPVVVQPIEPDPESLRSAPYQPRSGNDAVTLACLF